MDFPGGVKLPFADREEAGRLLAGRLQPFAGRVRDVVVLGLPRGGVPVAFEVAHALRLPLDVYLVRKLGAPGFEELAMGAIATGGIRVLNRRVIDELHITSGQVESVVERATARSAWPPRSPSLPSGSGTRSSRRPRTTRSASSCGPTPRRWPRSSARPALLSPACRGS